MAAARRYHTGGRSSAKVRDDALQYTYVVPTRRPRRRPGPTGRHRHCGICAPRHGERLTCKGKTALWSRRYCLYVSETVELPRSEGQRGHAATILGLEFGRRDTSSRRHRALDAKPYLGCRSTLVRGRRRQADIMSSRSPLHERILPIWRSETPKDDCEERRGVFTGGLPHHVEDVISSRIFIVIPTACGEASQPRHNRGSRPSGEAIIRDSKGSTAVIRVRVRCLVRVS